MSLIAEFTLRAPDLALTTALDADTDITVELEGQMATSSDTPVLVMWAFGGDFDTFEVGLDEDPTVRTYNVLEELGGRKLYRVRLASENLQPVYPVYQRLGAGPLAATGTHEGWQRRVRFPDRESVVEMREFCTENDVQFQLRRLYTPGESDLEDEFGLSPEQRHALVVAEQNGYFDVPRQLSLDDLGEQLGVSGQSASERLRRGASQLVRKTLLSDF
ncbi:helix-turn-helix domain-containing protein [Halorussus halophilus]|uniref:helix-turn-helix domain-containing protein n=1 Tax=Halorussus halophilus TaxID=2650975 RepID=UPI001300CDC3|nr:helix-turn-helix domain-containing protein [Halorussus halophilus]